MSQEVAVLEVDVGQVEALHKRKNSRVSGQEGSGYSLVSDKMKGKKRHFSVRILKWIMEWRRCLF